MAILPTILLLAVQGLDVGVHIATDQFELIRTVSSLIAATGAILTLLMTRHARSIGLAAGVGYLLLNTIFLVQHGLTNPATDALRIPLFGFIALTLIFLVWCVMRSAKTNA